MRCRRLQLRMLEPAPGPQVTQSKAAATPRTSRNVELDHTLRHGIDLYSAAHSWVGEVTLYSQRITQTAAVGKAPELRELNLVQVKARQAQGTRASFSTPMTGVGGRLVVGLSFDSPGDLQAFRERNASDTAFQQ